MEILKVYPTSIDGRAIARAAQALRDGKIIVYPTDSLYALACDALNSKAIQQLCSIKGINPDKQLLSVVCADISQAADYAYIDNKAFAVLKRNLPGPFTFILPASTKLPKQFKGRRSVGIRIPDNAIARAIAQELGNPVLSSSVNVDPDYPDDAANPDALAMAYDNDAALMIDGGEGTTQPSTVVDLTDSSSPEILRQGLGRF